jgi:hypothetical protein
MSFSYLKTASIYSMRFSVRFIVVLFALFIFSSDVNAAVYNLQTDDSVEQTGTKKTQWFTGVSGNINSAEWSFWNYSDFTTGTWVAYKIWVCESDDYVQGTPGVSIDTCTSAVDYDLSVDGVYPTFETTANNFCTKHSVSIPTSKSPTLTPEQYFYIELTANAAYGGTSNTIRACSSASDEISYSYLRSDGTDLYLTVSTDPNLDQLGKDFNSPYNTKFTSFTVSTSSPTSPTFTVSYYLDQDEVDTNDPARNPQQVAFQFSDDDLNPASFSVTIDPTATYGTTSYQYSIPANQPDGTMTVRAKFNNANCAFGGACPFPETYAYMDLEIASGTVTSIITQNEIYDSTSFLEPESRYNNCSLTQLDGCLKNAGIFMFYPNEFTLEIFDTQYDTFTQQIPFSYVYDFTESLTPTTTVATPELSVQFDDSFDEITIFSADFFDSPMVANAVNIINSFSTFIIYGTLGLYFFRRSKSFIHSISHV